MITNNNTHDIYIYSRAQKLGRMRIVILYFGGVDIEKKIGGKEYTSILKSGETTIYSDAIIVCDKPLKNKLVSMQPVCALSGK